MSAEEGSREIPAVITITSTSLYPKHNLPVFVLNHEIYSIVLDCYLKQNIIPTEYIVYQELLKKYYVTCNFFRYAFQMNGYELLQLKHEIYKEIFIEKDVFAKQREIYLSMMSTARSLNQDLIYIDERVLDPYFLNPLNINKMNEESWCYCTYCDTKQSGQTNTARYNIALFAVSLQTGIIAESYINTKKLHKDHDYFAAWVEKEIIPKLLTPSTIVFNRRDYTITLKGCETKTIDVNKKKSEENADGSEGKVETKDSDQQQKDSSESKFKARGHNVIQRLPTMINYNVFELVWNDLRKEMEEKDLDMNVTDLEGLYFIARSYLKKFEAEDWRRLDKFMEQKEKDRVLIDKKVDEVIKAILDFTNDETGEK